MVGRSPRRLFGLVCVHVSHGFMCRNVWQADGRLRGGAVVNDVVVVDVHQHGDGLADDERDPHGGVSVDSVQVAAHKERQRDLQQEEEAEMLWMWRYEGWVRNREGGDVTYLSHHSHEGP